MLSKMVELGSDDSKGQDDELSAFISRLDRIMFDLDSDNMKLVRRIFWDKVDWEGESLHSTM